MAKKRLEDIVVLLPGATGSVLQKDGRDIWGVSGQALWGGLTSFGHSLDSLRLPFDDPEIDDLGDGIRATRLIPDVTFIPGLVKIDGYTETARLITDNFEVTRGSIEGEKAANFFEFPYDWRRDCRAPARQLKQLIDRKLPQWRQHSGVKDAKIIFLAHSMGGLVARYYLEVLEGWRDCKALITFGTPYRGSVEAVGFLSNGYKQLFLDLTEVVRSFTSVYQLLPIYEMLHVGDAYRRVAETDDIPGIERTRAEQALAFHRAIEAAVNEHRRESEYLDHGYKILPILGTRQPTIQSARLADGRLTTSRVLPEWIDSRLSDGDGVVPRLSAIPIEMSEEYRDTYFPERHGSLQRNEEIIKDIRGRLEQMQVRGLSWVRGPEVSRKAEERPAISLDLDDLYITGEAVEMHAQLVNASNAVGPLIARIEAVGGAPVAAVKQEFREDERGWVLKVEGLPPGLYRVTVRTAKAGPSAPKAVHDLFGIANRA